MSHMARIVYGIQSTGFGHYTRSKAIIQYLISQGHDIQVVTSGKAVSLLKDEHDVAPIESFSFSFKGNRVSYSQTLIKQLANMKNIYFDGYQKTLAIVRDFKPDVIITDFEFFSAIAGKQLRIPVVSIDNIHTLVHSDAKYQSEKRFQRDRLEQEIAIRLLIPWATYYFITSFYPSNPLAKNVEIISPIYRKEILDTLPQVKDGEHILVYQSTGTHTELLSELKKMPSQKFIVYGFDQDRKDKNVTLKSFSQEDFLTDLATCKAVITNGGFSLITEAILFHKPILSNPLEQHYEQSVNAKHVEALTYGMYTKHINADTLQSFVDNIEHYKAHFSSHDFVSDMHEGLDAIDQKVRSFETPV
jgi:uncharacterized protein (TIGR00661 family)